MSTTPLRLWPLAAAIGTIVSAPVLGQAVEEVVVTGRRLDWIEVPLPEHTAEAAKRGVRASAPLAACGNRYG